MNYREINFPYKKDTDAPYYHYESANNTTYKWDGVKWDPWFDAGSPNEQHWVRVPTQELLYPRDTDDEIQVSGIRDAWLDPLP